MCSTEKLNLIFFSLENRHNNDDDEEIGFSSGYDSDEELDTLPITPIVTKAKRKSTPKNDFRAKATKSFDSPSALNYEGFLFSMDRTFFKFFFKKRN